MPSIVGMAFVLTVTLLSLAFAADGRSDDFSTYARDEAQRISAFAEAEHSAFAEYVASTRKRFVAYSVSGDARVIIDFDSGDVTAQAIVPEDGDVDAARKAVRESLMSILTTRDGPFGLLEDQVRDGQGTIVDSASSRDFAASQSNEASVEPGHSPGERLLTVRFDLIPDHLRVRAERFLPLVRDACRDNALPVSLVMAMIHVESAFNPRAVSSANAIGLMQVVAATGGREASHALHGRDREPSRRELTDPEHNIALGCRYLAVLRDRYFVRVSSPRSREYCMISAYNAGPGSVSRALAGSNDTSGVPGAIRDLTPSQVRGRLEQRLSSREGRAYLGKVLSRRELYAT